jgi:hypothetical protein
MKNHNKDNLYVLTVQYLKLGIFIYLQYLTNFPAPFLNGVHKIDNEPNFPKGPDISRFPAYG